jgi:heterodisulfide reductase subunit C
LVDALIYEEREEEVEEEVKQEDVEIGLESWSTNMDWRRSWIPLPECPCQRRAETSAFLRRKRRGLKRVETVAPYKEIIDVIKASGGEAFKRCFQCGLCDVVCPWNRVRTFSMRKIVREATFGLTDIESEDMWLCTTCGRCPQQCPRDVKQIESGVALRRIATEYGVFPPSVKPIRTVSASLVGEGNPLSEERAKRADWAEGLSVKPFTEGMEILYFPGCYLSYDPRLKKVARATANILNKAGVDFGILGAKENCCGESIRKTGDEELFKRWPRKTSRRLSITG